MPAFTRELTDAEWYTARSAGIATVLRNIDEKTTKAGNGTAGSTHTPGAAIVIGGAGMQCVATWNFNGAWTTSAGKHITLGGGASDDYLRLGVAHPGISRSIVVPVQPISPSAYFWAYSPTTDFFMCAFRFPGTRVLIPLTPHDRSTLASGRIYFKVTFTHVRLPVLPKFRIIRVDKSGNVEPLHVPRSGSYMDDGFLEVAAPANLAAYENGAALQWSQTYTTDQNNVVDLSTYAYFIEFVEESGPDAFTPDLGTSTGQSTDLKRAEITCNAISLLAPQ